MLSCTGSWETTTPRLFIQRVPTQSHWYLSSIFESYYQSSFKLVLFTILPEIENLHQVIKELESEMVNYKEENVLMVKLVGLLRLENNCLVASVEDGEFQSLNLAK
jgi:hypothetical protein